jgi:putative ABC transport system permease protein
MALGANRNQVLKLLLRQGLLVVLAGAIFGLLATFGISQAMSNLLVGVSATDPLTFVGATVFLVAIALCACYIPARRTTKLDPMVALRFE